VSERVRWGILSTGRINAMVIPGLHESPETELVAVASRDRDRAAAYAREWGIPRSYGSYDELLADDGVDVVYVSLPNGPHVEWSIRALEAGKHVLCEKALARLPSDVEAAFEVADRVDLLLMEAFMWRHHPQTRRLTELVHGGAIGELRLIRASFTFMLGDDPPRLDPGLLGGSLMDVGCYCVSGSRLLAGEPTTATAQQVTAETGADVRLAGTLVFPGDVLAQIDCAYDLPARQALEVIGSEGILFVPTPWGCHEPGIVYTHAHDRQYFAIEQADRYRRQTDNLSRAIRGLEPPMLGRDDALGQARTIDALYRSAEAGGEPAPV
jgi:D-xylose 1-dehydrogenase (NADP+, D-xylono-1,5-lactone-forming)